MKQQLIIIALALATYGLRVALSNKSEQETPISSVEAPTSVEIPTLVASRPEEILLHTDFTVSYNNAHLIPNWVAWTLTPERTNGSEKRAENFQPDESIQRGPSPQLADYRRSGYDRGHMCPSADNKHSRAAMNECFLLSNMCPQTHALNAGDWEQLESLCRKWAKAYDTIYIACGPVIEDGTTYATIGEGRVSVPREFFKVVLRLRGKGAPQAIGFVMPNDESVDNAISSYATTVDDIEARTGIDFFPSLPANVQDAVESSFDASMWQGLK